MCPDPGMPPRAQGTGGVTQRKAAVPCSPTQVPPSPPLTGQDRSKRDPKSPVIPQARGKVREPLRPFMALALYNNK